MPIPAGIGEADRLAVLGVGRDDQDFRVTIQQEAFLDMDLKVA